MLIGRDQVLELLHSRGQHDWAVRAAAELPGAVESDNARHLQLLAGYGIDIAALRSAALSCRPEVS